MVVIASRAPLFGDGGQVVSRDTTRTALDTLVYLGLVYSALMCLLIAWALWPSDELVATPLPRRSLVRTMVVPLLFTALAGLIWSMRLRGGGSPLPFDPGSAAAPGSIRDLFGLDPGLRRGPGGVDWTAAALAAGLTAIAAVVVWRRTRSSRASAPVPPPAVAQALLEIVDGTLDELGAGSDPRRAVIAAYARMETALTAAGLPRRPAQTAQEYLSRILGLLQVSERAATTLTELFERARFSRHEISDSMRAGAVACLAEIRAELSELRQAPAGVRR